MDAAFLKRLRKLCLGLPGTREKKTWDHRNFRVADKIFVLLGDEKGRSILCVKAGKSRQKELIRDRRFCVAPYVGRFGWVNYSVDRRPNWDEITGLILQSYRLIAPKRFLETMGAADE